MSQGMQSFVEGVGCLCIALAILAMGWYGIQTDPAFDPDREPKSPSNIGKAWVPE